MESKIELQTDSMESNTEEFEAVCRNTEGPSSVGERGEFEMLESPEGKNFKVLKGSAAAILNGVGPNFGSE